ncbi:unnamed protein product [Caenorhabditis bovis]|uniref:Carboxylic ester hydrolase n=1 Tax=Caenorhabditis bovis TaxID=2654633 RepID=A0A8S1ECA2_9PELO|nr:unnamed protein product [Caenorhabditis bovis]
MGGYLSHLTPEVATHTLDASCGPIRGNIYKHGDKIVEGYLGIPFGKPPVGELRFAKPVPCDKWDEVKDCTSYAPKCPQNILNPLHPSNVSEDCLALNVFRPAWESTEFASQGRPVMVYVHGGAFEFGASSDYCAYSITGTLPLKDVVFVTIHYRLSVFGFLTTGDENCKGNFGLWDQTLALKWIQQHIKSFGGDPNNVTVFGQSAGGVSVDFLSLSPHSRDLFHKMIPMSGGAGCEFAMRTAERQAQVFVEYAEFLGYKGSGDSKDLLEWYKSAPTELLASHKTFNRKTVSGFLTFAPNMDGDFFPKPLEQLRKEAPKKPAIVGICEQEGLVLCYFIAQNQGNTYDMFKGKVQQTFGEDIFDNPEQIQQKVVDYYMKGIDRTNEEEVKKGFSAFIGDALFNQGVFEMVQDLTKNGNQVFYYNFRYFNPESFGILESLIPFKAATHCTDLRYVLGEGVYSKFEPNEDEYKVLEFMTTTFTNFAKTGNPENPDWQPYSLDKPYTRFCINLPKSHMIDVFDKEGLKFWKELNKENKMYNELRYGK